MSGCTSFWVIVSDCCGLVGLLNSLFPYSFSQLTGLTLRGSLPFIDFLVSVYGSPGTVEWYSNFEHVRDPTSISSSLSLTYRTTTSALCRHLRRICATLVGYIFLIIRLLKIFEYRAGIYKLWCLVWNIFLVCTASTDSPCHFYCLRTLEELQKFRSVESATCFENTAFSKFTRPFLMTLQRKN